MASESASKKKKLGQFFTTNYDYILQGMKIPDGITQIIEPFAGNGDLLKFILDKSKFEIECYDIDPKHDYIIKQDTILSPPNYKGKYEITNPPYLAKNKTKDKAPFIKYPVDDLYKCHIYEISTSDNYPIGGIIIIPLNFWCSIRSADIELRRTFLARYAVERVNIFEEQVFDDTTYTVCAIQYRLKNERDPPLYSNITFHIYPAKISLDVVLSKKNCYLIGGEIYMLPASKKYEITRITSKNKMLDGHTKINVKCIDDGTEVGQQLGVEFSESDDIYIDHTPNLTNRTYATLLITPPINIETQKELVKKINKMLKTHRDKYHSLFLTNYRESKDSARKRISFDLIYLISGYILDIMDARANA